MAKPVIKNAEVVKTSGVMKIDIGDNQIDEAIKWLTRKKEEAEREVHFIEEFKGVHPLDVLVAFRKAMAEIYGWVDDVPTPGFFGSSPPKMVPVEVGFKKTTHVPFGDVKIPGLSGVLTTTLQQKPVPMMIIHGVIRKKDTAKAEEIMAKTREFLETESIYRGKAIKVSYDWKRKGLNYDVTKNSPQFMDLSGVVESDLVLSEKSQEQFTVGLLTPLRQAESCRLHKIPLKRGVLFAGDPGVGKTMAALVASRVAADNDWTVIHLDSILDLQDALDLAKYYQKALVVGEDFDRIVSGSERTLYHDMLTNALDGPDSKSTEIITVLTTNDVKSIMPVMLRRGRIDHVVVITSPDANAAVKLVKAYGRELLSPETDFEVVGAALAGVYPAAIQGIVEDAKLATIARLNGHTMAGSINHEDLLYAAKQSEEHNALVARKPKPRPKHVELHVWSDDGTVVGSKQGLAEFYPQINNDGDEEVDGLDADDAPF